MAARILVGWAMEYPGLYMACRATYRELEDSTKRIFLNGDGALPPAIPPEFIAKNGISKQDQKVVLTNGSEILFRSLEEDRNGAHKMRNITLSGAFIDQLEEFDSDYAHEIYGELVSRLSHPVGPRKLIAAANPAAETHWAYDRFVDEQTRNRKTRYIHVTLFDNEHHLPEDYVQWAKEQEEERPDFFRRFVLGEWGAFGGKRFRSWHKDRHIVDSDTFFVDPAWEWIEGIDFGINNPFAVVWVGIDFNDRWWVVDEHYESEQPLSYHAAKIFEHRERLAISPSFIFIDPSTFNRQRAEFESVAFELQELGIHAGRAQNERIGGWARLDELLTRTLSDGFPQLRVLDRCHNLIKELPNLRYKEFSDDVEKENDHASDALRYCVMSRPHTPMRALPEKTRREEAIEGIIERSLARKNERLVYQ